MRKGQQLVIGQVLDIQGEMMEIIVHDRTKLHVGSLWTCTYEHIEFKSKVLKKDGFHIYLYLPLFLDKFPDNRRKLPRLSCSFSAFLYQVRGGVYSFAGTATVIDINVKGFGFLSSEKLENESIYDIHIKDEKLEVQASIKIKNIADSEKENRYGCEILTINDNHLLSIREYMLSQQIFSPRK
ncbi:PilZ domain-containing protein [Pontibacillus marinus]|nr:PilZ domain-containing protein [Pontibacillus marinus]